MREAYSPHVYIWLDICVQSGSICNGMWQCDYQPIGCGMQQNEPQTQLFCGTLSAVQAAGWMRKPN